ncbi:hypothetical protein ICW40_20505, partial [Actinotalea ferrariae]|nr:hypothetical protein [Actinotalea ferrariae]
LVALAASAGSSADAAPVPLLLLLVALGVVVALALAAGRIRPARRAGLVVGTLAGVCFALMALSARGLAGAELTDLPRLPGTWLVVVAGLLGMAFAATALQRAPVVPATALMVGTETCLGAALGVVLAGDRWAPGSAPLVAAGFAAVLVGALLLARFGAPDRSLAAAEGAAAPGA